MARLNRHRSRAYQTAHSSVAKLNNANSISSPPNDSCRSVKKPKRYWALVVSLEDSIDGRKYGCGEERVAPV